MVFGFGKKKKKQAEEDEDKQEKQAEQVLFQGALNGKEANLSSNSRLVNVGLVPAKKLVSDALARRAEMIRLAPKGKQSIATFYIDGVPYAGERFSPQQGLATTQMLKLLAGLEVKERRKPQSGGINVEFHQQPYRLRVDVTPLKGGAERLIIRAQNLNLQLETPSDLGFSEELRQTIRKMTSQKRGIVLVCGPPNSGTTTTTYAILRTIDSYLYSVFSIADTEGHTLHNITPFEKNPDDDLDATLARVIRVEAEVLFLDPLTDAETTRSMFEMQNRLAMLSELKADTPAEGILTLIDWIGNPQTVAQGLHGIFSQKLIRVLCDECKQAFRPHPKLIAKAGLPPETKVLYRPPKPKPNPDPNEPPPAPCQKCSGIGYYGRTALIAYIEITDEMKELIAGGPSIDDIKAEVRKEGMPSFQKEALRRVAEGITSMEELQRAFAEPGSGVKKAKRTARRAAKTAEKSGE